MSHNNPWFIGFLCEHAQGNGTEMRLITPPDAPADDPTHSMRGRFVVNCFHGKHVMGTHGSRVIIRMEDGPRQGSLYTSQPCESKPWVFSSVGRTISPMTKHPDENTLGQFVVLPLDNGAAGVMGTVVKGCLEYTAGPHPQGDLAIVHLDDGWLVRWVLTREGDMAVWNQEVRVHLAGAFGHLMNTNVLDALVVEQSDWHAIQVRAVSQDGRYVLISVGVVYGLYVVDMVDESAEAAPELGQMGRVFPMSQTWPPRP